MALSEDNIDFEWDRIGRHYHIPLNEVEDIELTYGGYSGLGSPYKGNTNHLRFKHKGHPYDLQFVLKNADHAAQMATLLRSWYDKGFDVKEQNAEGKEIYLMFYEPHKKYQLVKKTVQA